MDQITSFGQAVAALDALLSMLHLVGDDFGLFSGEVQAGPPHVVPHWMRLVGKASGWTQDVLDDERYPVDVQEQVGDRVAEAVGGRIAAALQGAGGMATVEAAFLLALVRGLDEVVASVDPQAPALDRTLLGELRAGLTARLREGYRIDPEGPPDAATASVTEAARDLLAAWRAHALAPTPMSPSPT